MYLLGGDFEGMLICENVGKWRNLKCILIRFFPQKILEIFTYCTKTMQTSHCLGVWEKKQ